jgi:hypothetical protein
VRSGAALEAPLLALIALTVALALDAAAVTASLGAARARPADLITAVLTFGVF